MIALLKSDQQYKMLHMLHHLYDKVRLVTVHVNAQKDFIRGINTNNTLKLQHLTA